MSTTWLQCVLIACFLGFSSCGKDEPAPAPKTSEQVTQPEQSDVPKAPPTKAALAGSPSGSGFTDATIRVQVGPDEALREQHHPEEGNKFFFVRLAVKGEATLVPKDYRIVAGNKQYTPHAIGFGRPSGVYSSVEYFVGEQVELAPGKADQILHDGERIKKCELKNPMVFLVYDLPQALSPALWHGNQKFSLDPDFVALTSDLSGEGGTLTANSSLNMTDPNQTLAEFSAELVSSTRTRMELNARQIDVVVLTIELSAPKAATIELKKEDMALRGNGGSSKGGTTYFHFAGATAALTAGSSYIEGDTYEGKALVGLNSGGFRLPVSPAPVTMTALFPDPKVPGNLELELSSAVAVTIPEPVNPLGKFPPPVEKMPSLVAWSPIIGTPTDAGFLADSASVAADYKRFASPAPRPAGSGLKYLMVQFRMDADAQFTPIDYRIAEQESNTVYKALGVSFGESPVYVSGLDYEQLALKLGSETKPTVQSGKLIGWNLKTGDVKLLFEVAPAKAYVFIHGGTQFLIEL
jgi:hypothetical protein